MNLRFCLAISILFIFSFKVVAQELPFVHYTPDNELNPLPSAMVTNVFQDSEGFMWLAVHSSGLIRFDGTKMDLYGQKEGVKDLGVWQIVEDKLGYLWVTSNSGLVVSEEPVSNYKNGRRLTFTSEFGGKTLYSEIVNLNQIAVDSSGIVWVGTVAKGFLKYHINEKNNLEVDVLNIEMKGSTPQQITTLFSGKTGILAGIGGGQLVRISGNKIQLIYSSDKISEDQNFASILEDEKGKIWAYRQNGEVLLFQNESTDPKKIAQLKQSNIASLATVTEGNVWAVSGVNGIIRFNQKSGEIIGHFTRSNGLLSDNVFNVSKDREGNVWIAQSGGISKLRFNFNAFENFSTRSIAGEKPILPSAKVNSILRVPSGTYPFRLLAGTEGGVSCISEEGTSTYITQADGLTGDWVNGLEIDSEGRIWIATTQGLNGLVFDQKLILKEAEDIRTININGKQGIIFTIPDSPPIIASENLFIKGSPENEDLGSIWFAGLRSIIGVVSGKIYSFGIESGLPPVLNKSIAFDGNGYLWVGTVDKGIYRSTKKITREYLSENADLPTDSNLFEQFWSTQNGSPTNHIEKLLWKNGKMWVGTQEGLLLLDQDTGAILNHITKENGLPANNTVSFALAPKTQNLWVGTNSGLAEVDIESGEVIKKVTKQDGLIDDEVWLYGSVKVDKDGLVYFGTANGLSIYNPLLDRKNNIPPPVKLTSVLISYRTEGRNEAIFEYSALSFSNISGVRYKTRLLGYDEEWSPETNQKRLRYTNLPAFFWSKSYTLEVVAINDSGVESSEPMTYTFMVKPIWWLRWWAFLILIFIFGIVIFSFDRVQRRRVLRKEREIAKLREAELHADAAIARSLASEAQARALKADNEKKALELEKIQELEKAYQELKAAQNQLIQAEKMASLGRLATGIAHEIKNPLNFVNNFAALSGELVDELTQAIRDNNQVEIDYLMENIKINAGLIEEHGKRADAIVRSMMQHTRQGKSTFEIVEINNLVEKYIDLTYNSKGAHNPGFFTAVKKDFHPNLKKVKISGQEIGQVLINIIGNAFDAVWEKSKNNPEGYEPEVSISTFMAGDKVGIRISDNGKGIPIENQEKIFEPFFTTKPTGEGTGLGLSLSYEIITQGHNGSLLLEKKNGEGASFVILLPVY
ncbi:two-component regulator propeller domain-containing protein [Aquiflexum gelatinilyticum]|uniref:sensor histidine kinase n=1 Tax=Aquiflexum gelatinilyticum TaxID=2961943 RepID=UPI002169EBA9|nr:two-component regulator propeller domain-containing protein [Aquiflexum gelatinilyticum]MCS4434918.1 ATP-binding protein [Aquiflexum gelatinilyticum]